VQRLHGLTSRAATPAIILPWSWSWFCINGLILHETEAVGVGGMMMIDDDFPPMGDQSGLLPSPAQTAQPSRHGPAFPDLAAAAAPSGSEPALPTQPRQRRYSFVLISYLAVWGVEPVVTHQTSWLESTGVCGVRQNQAGGSSV